MTPFMNEFFFKNRLKRLICLILTTVFLTTFPTGASALALCLDEGENHLIGRSLSLADCHSSGGVNVILSEEHCSALAERESRDCTDISLTSANILNRPSKIILPSSGTIFLSYAIPSGRTGFLQHTAVNGLSSISLALSTLPRAHALRTVVLLI